MEKTINLDTMYTTTIDGITMSIADAKDYSSNAKIVEKNNDDINFGEPLIVNHILIEDLEECLNDIKNHFYGGGESGDFNKYQEDRDSIIVSAKNGKLTFLHKRKQTPKEFLEDKYKSSQHLKTVMYEKAVDIVWEENTNNLFIHFDNGIVIKYKQIENTVIEMILQNKKVLDLNKYFIEYIKNRYSFEVC